MPPEIVSCNDQLSEFLSSGLYSVTYDVAECFLLKADSKDLLHKKMLALFDYVTIDCFIRRNADWLTGSIELMNGWMK